MMFRVRLELYGNRMTRVVDAVSIDHAKQIVRGDIVFHEVHKEQLPYQTASGNELADFVKKFKKKKL